MEKFKLFKLYKKFLKSTEGEYGCSKTIILMY